MTSPPACPRSSAVLVANSALPPTGRDVTQPQSRPASVRGTHAAARAPPPGTRVCRGHVGAGAVVADDSNGMLHRMSSAVLPPKRGERTVAGTHSTASAVPSLRNPSRRMDATTLPRHILRDGVDQFRRSEAGQFCRASKSGTTRARLLLHQEQMPALPFFRIQSTRWRSAKQAAQAATRWCYDTLDRKASMVVRSASFLRLGSRSICSRRRRKRRSLMRPFSLDSLSPRI